MLPTRLAATLVVSLAATAAHAEVKGQIALQRVKFTVADAVAYKTSDGVEVALLSKPLDRAEAAKDRKIDTFDVMRAGGPSLTLRIGKEGPSNCMDYSTGSGGGSTCNGDLEKAVSLTTNTPERVAGRFLLKTDEGTADVTFDLPVESTAERKGTALPADGGEPGKALLAHFAALEKGDFAALKATARPEQRKMMEASEKSGEAKKMFEMLRAMSPTKVKVTGGTMDGDTASVDFTGMRDGQTMSGVADVVRIGGTWYVKGTSTRQ